MPINDVDAVLRRAEEAMHQHFGHSVLRPFQRDAIAAWAAGKDVLVTLATGAGKSLCFQLPALCEPPGRFSLVISPLVALMQDQVRTLKQRQIRAALCGSGARGDIAASWPALESGDFQIVYMCPEFAMNNLERLKNLRSAVCLLAVDEVHCVSSWGHDFRPQYRKLGRLRDVFPGVPILGATATCTQEVRSDIMQSLLFRSDAVLVNAPMNRSNLKYIVQQRSSLAADLGPLFAIEDTQAKVSARRAMVVDNTIIGPTSSAIIYVATKACCEEIASWLSSRGVAAMAYHAGLRMETRQAVHRDFIVDNVQVVVATIAFGMGIDKPSIRRIIHYGPVQTLEHYVQQCGRAGRDGEIAECMAFVKPDQDSTKARALIMQDLAHQPESQARAQRMLSLNAELTMFLKDSSSCRRLRLLRYFGESPKQWSSGGELPQGECVLLPGGVQVTCQSCDICMAFDQRTIPQEREDSEDFSLECRVLLQCVDACRGKMGSGVACAMAAGHETNQVRSRGLAKTACFGKGSARSLQWWKDFLPHVRQEGFLQEQVAVLSSGIKYAAISVSGVGRSFLNDIQKHFELSPVPKELRSKSSRAVAAVASQIGTTPRFVRASALTPSESLYRRLGHVRLAWQRREGLPGESLVSNAALKSFVDIRPSSIDVARKHIREMPVALCEGLLSVLVDECKQFCIQYSLCMDEIGEDVHASVSNPQLARDPRPERANSASTGSATASSSGLQQLGSPEYVKTSQFSEEAFRSDQSSSWLCKSSVGKKAVSVNVPGVDPCLSLDKFEFKASSSPPAGASSRDGLEELVEDLPQTLDVTRTRAIDSALLELQDKEKHLEEQLCFVREEIRKMMEQRQHCSKCVEQPMEIEPAQQCSEVGVDIEPKERSDLSANTCGTSETLEPCLHHKAPGMQRKLPWKEYSAASVHGDLELVGHKNSRERSRSRSIVTRIGLESCALGSNQTTNCISTDSICGGMGESSQDVRLESTAQANEEATICPREDQGDNALSWTDEWLGVLDL